MIWWGLLFQVVVSLLIYISFKKKYDNLVKSTKLKNDLEQLIIAFNRNAEESISLLEQREAGLNSLIQEAEAKEKSLKKQLDNSKKIEKNGKKKLARNKLEPDNSKLIRSQIDKSIKMTKTRFNKMTNNEKIYFLNEKEKMNVEEIANKLDLPIAEVKLVLSLK